MEYKIIESYSTKSLANKINIYLQLGWKLQGGCSQTKSGYYTRYVQSLYKEI